MRSLLDVYAALPEPRTVAVVGNQPLEPDEERGKAIDAADLVIRVNGFRIDDPGTPPTVGSRCHVVVFNRALRATKWVFEDYRRRLYLMVEPGRLHWEPDNVPGWWPADLGFVPVSNREVTLPLSDALGLPTGEQATWATTGTMAAWIARTSYPEAELILTGFSFVDNPTQTSWMHAAGDSCIVGPEHQIAAEGRLLETWLQTSRTTLLR
ncbi:MAG: hypothetical protein GEV28_16785 [Actinophytocola sp.]|uniref:glycosyltransferase family 29 protein n=1 Tax=Actinophytocola sp. TaxID=1872138 RepID=UPI0013215668|nr:glycosyltransferase family 29 protein [Actinophytocola sp.]MPZ81952.1 hypothetical protein [Actinophytocola sp.]